MKSDLIPFLLTAASVSQLQNDVDALIASQEDQFTVPFKIGDATQFNGKTESFAMITIVFRKYLPADVEKTISELIATEVPEIMAGYRKSQPELLLNCGGVGTTVDTVEEMPGTQALGIEELLKAGILSFLARNPQFTNSFQAPEPVKVIKAKKTATSKASKKKKVTA